MQLLSDSDRAKALDHRISDHEQRLARCREILSTFHNGNDADLALRQGATLAGELEELKTARSELRGN